MHTDFCVHAPCAHTQSYTQTQTVSRCIRGQVHYMDSFANLQLCGQRSNAKHLSNHWITHVRPQLRMDTQTRTHTHTVGPRLNICPACPDSPFWTLIAASNMKTHTHIYTHILWKRWLCRYFVTPDGDVTAHSSINGQLPFHGGQARDEGPHKPDYTKLQFSQNRFLENCRLLTLCNFSFSKSKTQEHKSKEGLKSGFICSDVSYNRIACLTFWLKES